MRLKTTDPKDRTSEQIEAARLLEEGPRGRLGGPFLPLLEHPNLFDHIQKLGSALRFKSKLPGPLRELAILVCARHWTAQYEWYAHSGIGRREGLSEKIMTELAQGMRPSGMSEDEALIHDFCAALHTTKNAPDELLQKAQARLGADGVIELIALSGYYTLISMVLNVADVPIPDGETPLASL